MPARTCCSHGTCDDGPGWTVLPGGHQGTGQQDARIIGRMAQGLYLGREVDAVGALGARVELDPADLLTHGIVVGMTGSGKTGLAVVLIEEVLKQGIPVLAIDPKGDLGNLLLLSPTLAAADFARWVDKDAARRQGHTPEAAGAQAALAWSKGLAEWGLGPADLAALQAARDAVIFTPGSSAGVPLGLLQSLEPPPGGFATDEDRREEATGLARALLGLLRRDTDPVRSPDALLLTALFDHVWKSGRGLGWEELLTAVGEPPFAKLGVLPVDTVHPRKERQELVLALNSLLASPSFEAWRTGEPLDIDRMMRTADGRPRLAVVSTSHLGDEERLFVTALVLERVKTWMRRQGGTSTPRLLVYMDEIYGYFPPHPLDPPTKKPLLTLLKQARAQGVSVVLATQNPVDLDYKGLSNMGLWMVGRLQTAQDRERLSSGLQGAGLEPAAVETLLDGTRKRVFLVHDVHRPKPFLLHSRWSMSYLRGPLTREDVEALTAARKASGPAAAAGPAAAPAPGGPPPRPAELEQLFLDAPGNPARPHLMVKYAVRYKGSEERVEARAWPLAGATLGEDLESPSQPVDESHVASVAPPGATWASAPAWVASVKAREVERVVKDRLPDKLAVKSWSDPRTKMRSQPGETLEAFAARVAAAGGGPAAARLAVKLEKKKRDLQAKEEEVSARRNETWAAVGGAVLSNIGILMGRKKTISGAGGVLSKNRMQDAAEAKVAALKAEVAQLEQELAAARDVDVARFASETLVPLKSGFSVLRTALLWM
jgi:hypothetical protein